MRDIVERLRDRWLPSWEFWDLHEKAAAEIESLRKQVTIFERIHKECYEGQLQDAARWRYTRDTLTKGMGLKMDGLQRFVFLQPKGRGRTIDEVIDKLIEESE